MSRRAASDVHLPGSLVRAVPPARTYCPTQPHRCDGAETGPAGHCLACGAGERERCGAGQRRR